MKLKVNERVHLSEIRTADAAAYVEHLNEREIYERTLRIPLPYTERDAQEWLVIIADLTARHGRPVHFAIRDEDERLIGGIGFEGVTFGHRAEIGYWLARPFWGRGIMTDAVRAACNLAFTDWKLVRITAHVFDFNLASARVLEKNGFQLEGLLRKHFCKDGRFIDSKLYALTP